MADAATDETLDPQTDDAASEEAPQQNSPAEEQNPEATEATDGTETPEEQEIGVEDVDLPQAVHAPEGAAGGQIDILLDTPMPVTVRLGAAEMPIGQLLQLSPGSVVTIDRKVGQPVELLLRGIPFATGQLVVVGEQMAVRIQEMIRPDAVEEAVAEDG